LAASPSPFGETPLSELDVPLLGFLPLLVDELKREQDSSGAPLFGEQQTENHPQPVDLKLPYVAAKVVDIGMREANPTNLLH
jgi:hypothetical protein